jgi:hypothetical protein
MTEIPRPSGETAAMYDLQRAVKKLVSAVGVERAGFLLQRIDWKVWPRFFEEERR